MNREEIIKELQFIEDCGGERLPTLKKIYKEMFQKETSFIDEDTVKIVIMRSKINRLKFKLMEER